MKPRLRFYSHTRVWACGLKGEGVFYGWTPADAYLHWVRNKALTL